MRELLTKSLKTAMKEKAQKEVSTLRLILAAIKDRDIAARTATGDAEGAGIGETEILELLQKMVKQRQESIAMFEKGGRLDAANEEREEIEIINGFLPKALNADEAEAAVAAAIDSVGATSIKQMGAVMAKLKADYVGRMDFAAASKQVKAQLG